MQYYARTERYIYKLMQSFKITDPEQLSIENISSIIRLPVRYWNYSSESIYIRTKKMVFINETISTQKQWQEFGHELCHILWHVGRQEHLRKEFYSLQEWQADNFSYHFCVPTFMLRELKKVSVYDVMKLFNVEFDFALRRLEMYKNKQFQYYNHNQISHSWIADEPSAYSNDQIPDSDILNDDFYDTFNLEVNAAEKIQETIEFWHYIQRRKIL